jgi:hypothetical protein
MINFTYRRFRWAQCQLDTLSRCKTPKEVIKALNILPETLDETSRAILDYIETESKEIVRRVLLWLAIGKRPLDIEELAEAVIIQIRTFKIDADDRLLEPEILLKICECLTVMQEDGIVNLAHYSVKRYIMSGRAQEFNLNEMESEQELAESCLIYLLLDELTHEGLLERRDLCPYFDELPLLDYSCRHWWQHAKKTPSIELAVVDLCMEYLRADDLRNLMHCFRYFISYLLYRDIMEYLGIRNIAGPGARLSSSCSGIQPCPNDYTFEIGARLQCKYFFSWLRLATLSRCSKRSQRTSGIITRDGCRSKLWTKVAWLSVSCSMLFR